MIITIYIIILGKLYAIMNFNNSKNCHVVYLFFYIIGLIPLNIGKKIRYGVLRLFTHTDAYHKEKLTILTKENCLFSLVSLSVDCFISLINNPLVGEGWILLVLMFNARIVQWTGCGCIGLKQKRHKFCRAENAIFSSLF